MGLAILARKNSKLSDLLWFMEQSTLRKVHPRNSICRLCGDAFESIHLLRVFGRASKAGSNKNLASKIQNVCGIFITESDSLSMLIYRKSKELVSEASEFRQSR